MDVTAGSCKGLSGSCLLLESMDLLLIFSAVRYGKAIAELLYELVDSVVISVGILESRPLYLK